MDVAGRVGYRHCECQRIVVHYLLELLSGVTDEFVEVHRFHAVAHAADVGVGEFVAECDRMAERYGDRFAVSPWLRDRADAGQAFGVELESDDSRRSNPDAIGNRERDWATPGVFR